MRTWKLWIMRPPEKQMCSYFSCHLILFFTRALWQFHKNFYSFSLSYNWIFFLLELIPPVLQFFKPTFHLYLGISKFIGLLFDMAVYTINKKTISKNHNRNFTSSIMSLYKNYELLNCKQVLNFSMPIYVFVNLWQIYMLKRVEKFFQAKYLANVF